jgi:hypothetical protein
MPLVDGAPSQRPSVFVGDNAGDSTVATEDQMQSDPGQWDAEDQEQRRCDKSLHADSVALPGQAAHIVDGGR